MMMPRTLLFLLLSLFAAHVRAAEPGRETPRQYQLFERYWPAPTPSATLNPYDPASIRLDAVVRTPSGEPRTVPLFYDRPCTRSEGNSGQEVVSFNGKARWTLRYTPVAPGRHDARVLQARGDGDPVEIDRFSFEVQEADESDRGFLRVNKTLGDRLAFDNGEGYFALGHNVCWVTREQGTYGYDRYFKKMARAGENYTRVWLCTWGIDLDTRRPYAIDLMDAWRLDHVLTEAAKRDIYVKLCLDNFYDFRNNWDKSPFNADNGGPCQTRIDFFTGDEAAHQYRARLRYLIARYGAFTSLLAWELWNETEYSLLAYSAQAEYKAADSLRDNVLIPWTLEAAKAIRNMDPHRHLVTTSLGMHTEWSDLWKSEHIDIVQYHSYIHYLDILRAEMERDAAGFSLHGFERIHRYGKPAFLSEFGYMGEGSKSSMNPTDPKGVALHNALWAGAHSGAMGTPMLWWWDNYIDPNDLYYRYASLAGYLKGVDWTRPFTPMRAEDADARVLALRSDRLTLLWIQNLQGTWYKRLRAGVVPDTLNNVELMLDHFPEGTYRIEWYDSQAGQPISDYEQDAEDGRLRLRPPSFQYDIAAKLRLVRE